MRPHRIVILIILLLAFAVCIPQLCVYAIQFFAEAEKSLTAEKLTMPMWIDYAAVFIFGISGTMTARAKNYDFVGAFALAGITAMGGALLRDGLCIQCDISPLFTDRGYILSLIAAWIVGMFFGEIFVKNETIMVIIDAAGLGLYTVFGTNKAIDHELSIPVAVGIGMINGVGGGLLRDIIARDEPMVFKPGQHYTAVAVLASVLYICLYRENIPPTLAATIVVIASIFIRILVVKYDIHSTPISENRARIARYIRAIRKGYHENKDKETRYIRAIRKGYRESVGKEKDTKE